MGSPKRHKKRWYNSWCLQFLSLLRYTVEPNTIPKGWVHLIAIGLPFTMSIISLVTLKEINSFLVIYHFFSLSFKLFIAFFENKNFTSKKDSLSQSVKKDIITPYFLRVCYLVCSVSLLGILLLCACFSVTNITILTFSSVTVYMSLILALLDNLTSGIVALYSATVKLPDIVA